MRDDKTERRPSHPKTKSNVTEHDRASLGSSNPPKLNPIQNGGRIHHLCDISPPPLKRKRTAHEQSYRRQDGLSVTTPSTLNSLHRQPAFSTDLRSNCKLPARPLPTLPSSSARHDPGAHEAQICNDSLLRKTLGPFKPSPKSGPCKPVCRVCDKTTATSYNPIISCPGCARSYHDSCRRPPLMPGVDPQRWRCSACSSGSGKSAKPMLSSKPVLVKSSVVRNIFKPRHARSPIVDATKPSDRTALGEHVHTQTFRASTTCVRWLGSLDRPKEVFETSLQSEPERFDSSEILSTSKRHSDQPRHLESSSQQHHVQAQVGQSAPSSPVPVQNRDSSMAVCSGCRQASISVRPGDGNPQCQVCRNKSHVEEMRRLEIPETPNAAAPYTMLQVTNSAESTTLMTAHDPADGAESSSWFDPNRTNTLDHASTEPPHNGQECEKDYQKSFDPSKLTQEAESPACVSRVMHETEETQVHIYPRQPHMPSIDDATTQTSCSEQQESGRINWEGSSKAGSPSVSAKVPTKPNADEASLYLPQRHQSYRELARIALVCANGLSMSAPQIIDWLLQRFPCLQQEQGSWEKSLKTVLSLKEFCSQKAIGLDEVCVVYSFANEAYKTRYENEYRDYIASHPLEVGQQQVFRPTAVAAPTDDSSKTIENTQEQLNRDHLGEASKSVSTKRTKDIWRNASEGATSSQHSAAASKMLHSSFILSPASTSCDNSTPPSPFKLSKFSLARDMTEWAPEVKRETSFHEAYPCDIRSSIEMMTAEEKARKVAEIRERPSRKQLFDSGQRLAHVRRYRRQDPHDESDGAWKPPSVKAKEKPTEDDIAKSRDEPRSLCEVFRLPANAVPMLNEGNELAFRDGTMVNGRLPRPRRIYRVGKRLGAGLTVN